MGNFSLEGFVAAKYDEILGLEPQGLTAEVLCAAGFRGESDKYASLAKVRWAAADVIDHR